MPWLMLAKMPLLISSRMTSAGLTPRRSARSLTVMLDGSSIAARSRGAPGWSAPPRVPLLLLATITSCFDPARLPCQFGLEFGRDRHFQRSLERPFVERRGSALLLVPYI